MQTVVIIGVLFLLLAGRGPAEELGRLARAQPVVDPEALSGVWAAPDGRGGWVEVEIEIVAMLPLGGSLASGPFLLAHTSVGVCHGLSVIMHSGDCDYFTDNPDGGVWIGKGSLRVASAALGGSSDVALNLSRDGSGWAGTFRRKDWSGRVRLQRGEPGDLTGTWLGGGYLHVGEWRGMLGASLDQLQDPAKMRYANGIRPHPLVELFGKFVGAERNAAGFVSFEIGGSDEGAAGGMMRTIRVRPRLRRRGRRHEVVLTGMQSGDGRSAEPDWVRVQGGSCRGR